MGNPPCQVKRQEITASFAQIIASAGLKNGRTPPFSASMCRPEGRRQCAQRFRPDVRTGKVHHTSEVRLRQGRPRQPGGHDCDEDRNGKTETRQIAALLQPASPNNRPRPTGPTIGPAIRNEKLAPEGTPAETKTIGVSNISTFGTS